MNVLSASPVHWRKQQCLVQQVAVTTQEVIIVLIKLYLVSRKPSVTQWPMLARKRSKDSSPEHRRVLGRCDRILPTWDGCSHHMIICSDFTMKDLGTSKRRIGKRALLPQLSSTLLLSLRAHSGQTWAEGEPLLREGRVLSQLRLESPDLCNETKSQCSSKKWSQHLLMALVPWQRSKGVWSFCSVKTHRRWVLLHLRPST